MPVCHKHLLLYEVFLSVRDYSGVTISRRRLNHEERFSTLFCFCSNCKHLRTLIDSLNLQILKFNVLRLFIFTFFVFHSLIPIIELCFGLWFVFRVTSIDYFVTGQSFRCDMTYWPIILDQCLHSLFGVVYHPHTSIFVTILLFL